MGVNREKVWRIKYLDVFLSLLETGDDSWHDFLIQFLQEVRSGGDDRGKALCGRTTNFPAHVVIIAYIFVVTKFFLFTALFVLFLFALLISNIGIISYEL